MKQVVAWILIVIMVLSGCSMEQSWGVYDLVYTRPDMTAIMETLDNCCRVAETSTDISQVEKAIFDFYDVYDGFFSAYNLSYIRYCGDLTDSYWEGEYTYCENQMSQVEAGLEQLYQALAKSPIRDVLDGEEYFGPGFLDAYEGESMYNEAFLELMEREAALLEEYYNLCQESAAVEFGTDEYYAQFEPLLGENLLDLIRVRQEMATCAGYDSYVDLAYDFYYYRDYTPAQAEELGEEIRREMIPLYRQINKCDLWDEMDAPCSTEEAVAYVKTVTENMGGHVKDIFRIMEEGQLYDMRVGENRYDISFESYLYTYAVPYIFVNPRETVVDKLTLIHEFGHFSNDYMCGGSYAGTDVAEVFSQGMEYMSLCYGGDEMLGVIKQMDCLCLYVEQMAYAMFEQQMYALEGENLTLENLRALYKEICLSYGFDSWDWDSRDYVTVGHFYMEPMYIISYVVSNDVAFQLYQKELAQFGAGRDLLEENLSSWESYIVHFAQSLGLESPFEPGRIAAARATLETMLAPYIEE